MTELQQKQLALLEDTVKFFNSENRCINQYGGCNYYLEGKEGCAIGRKIEDKELCKELDKGLGPDLESAVDKISVFNRLPDNLKELGQKFLYRLQRLHDDGENWIRSGISSKGEIIVKDIKETFNLN